MDWLNSLPDHLRPPPPTAKELDDFRESIGCPDEAFGLRILGSAWAIRKTLRLVYEQARSEEPAADEATLAGIVYESRRQLSEMTETALPAQPGGCDTFDSVADFIVREEARQAMPDPYGWGKKIDSILAKG